MKNNKNKFKNIFFITSHAFRRLIVDQQFETDQIVDRNDNVVVPRTPSRTETHSLYKRRGIETFLPSFRSVPVSCPIQEMKWQFEWIIIILGRITYYYYAYLNSKSFPSILFSGAQ